MPYVRVADPLLNSDKPGRSTDMKQIRDNQDYFDAQINTLTLLSLISSNSIADDFMGVDGTSGLGSWWTSVAGAGDTVDVYGEHQLRLLTNGNATGDYAGVQAAAPYQTIGKGEEYVAVMEARVKRVGTDAGSYLFGWQDSALATGAQFSDVTDFVGVIRDGTGNWTAMTALGGSGSSVGSFGNAANWEVIQLRFTCSATAGNRKVEVYLNGSLQGTMNTDAKIPSAVLVPTAGCRGDTTGAASREVRFDYLIFTVAARPLAA